MPSSTCKVIKKSGERCKRKANSSGYCHTHDPGKVAEREVRKQALELQKFDAPAKRFSQRRGFKPVSTTIQVESINQDLRNSLWNVMSTNFLLEYSKSLYSSNAKYYGLYVDDFVADIWVNYFKFPLDHLPERKDHIAKILLEHFQKCEWYEVYDFLEATLNYFQSSKLVEEVNFILERELAAYRFIGGVFTGITDKQEIEMLTNAVDDRDFPAVSSHLKRALSLMSNKESPDYRNSIKESISAVESLAKAITNKPKATLGEALVILESSNNLHAALKKSFLSLYGYTSDEGGIRHAMLSEPNLTVNDAKFFLLSCTSFINYLKSKI